MVTWETPLQFRNWIRIGSEYSSARKLLRRTLFLIANNYSKRKKGKKRKKERKERRKRGNSKKRKRRGRKENSKQTKQRKQQIAADENFCCASHWDDVDITRNSSAMQLLEMTCSRVQTLLECLVHCLPLLFSAFRNCLEHLEDAQRMLIKIACSAMIFVSNAYKIINN